MPVPDRAALRLLFLAGTDVPMKIKMLNQRYNLDRSGEDTALAGAGNFETATLDRIWDLLERLPEEDLADNKWLEEFTRRTNPTAPIAQGVTGDNRVAVGYDPAHLDDPDLGTYSAPGDQMHGTVIFDRAVLHEMGHASDRQYGWTADGGPFDTDPDLGAWANHAPRLQRDRRPAGDGHVAGDDVPDRDRARRRQVGAGRRDDEQEHERRDRLPEQGRARPTASARTRGSRCGRASAATRSSPAVQDGQAHQEPVEQPARRRRRAASTTTRTTATGPRTPPRRAPAASSACTSSATSATSSPRCTRPTT